MIVLLPLDSLITGVRQTPPTSTTSDYGSHLHLLMDKKTRGALEGQAAATMCPTLPNKAMM
jgi:hypothetical protein